MSDAGEPVPFEVFREGVYLHGTKADRPRKTLGWDTPVDRLAELLTVTHTT